MWGRLPLVQLHGPKVVDLGSVRRLPLRRLFHVDGITQGRFLAKCTFFCQRHLELIVR